MTTVRTSPQAPVPCLDHVMVLVEQDAYAAVVAEEFVGTQFARRKHKQADSSIAGSYSTLGLAGRNTLIELFEAVPGGSPLVGGLVFSFERKGSVHGARTMLDEADGVEYHYDLVRRTVDEDAGPQPWYHLINVDLGPGSPVLLFLNEVTPEYFASIGAVPAGDTEFRRSAYLDAALGDDDVDGRSFGDIRGVHLAVRPGRADRIAAALTPFGFEARRDEEGTRLARDDLTLSLGTVETGPERVTEIHLELTGNGDTEPGREINFGSGVRLVIESDSAARWIFG